MSFDHVNGGTHFNYSFTNPELVRSAWIEVLDRPLVLIRKPLAVGPSGELTWDWNQNLINCYEQPEDTLVLSIWDPSGETVECDVNTVMTAHPGGIVSSTTVGAREKISLYPQLSPAFMRVTPGSDAVTMDVTGMDLSRLAKFSVEPSKGARCDKVHAEVLNFAHARITVPRECLQNPGILAVSTDGDRENSVGFHIVSRHSPVLRSVAPAVLPENLPQSKLKLVLRGRGFTESSIVYAGYSPDAGNYMTDQLLLETEYVSPTELRVTARTDADGHKVSDKVSAGEKLRIWVKGDEEKYELPESVDVALGPAAGGAKLVSVRDIDFQRRRKTNPAVTSVTPFPIKLMNEHSPAQLEVTIEGENFVPEDKVRFAFGSQADNDQEVRTAYVSPTMLRAWLPRQLFRKHQITYRIVVKTTTGQRYSGQVADKSDYQ